MEWSKLLSESRRKPTTRKTTAFDLRTEFESDYGRIVFSPAIRRMHDKTQVFPLTDSDNIHSRLTHSLEVESVSQSIVTDLIEKGIFNDISNDKSLLFRNLTKILASISLCHDIGNPPFGHFGEEIISRYFEDYFESNVTLCLTEDQKKDFTKFNENAQGFRVLTKLQVLQDTNGLNLTAATLASFLKYPNLSSELSNDKFYHKKLGVYQSEKDHIEFIREETGIGNKRHPLSFLMEAADSICYYAMDIEDGFNKKYYKYEDVINFFKEKGSKSVRDYITNTDERIDSRVKDDRNKEQTKMVNLRISLIQHLVEKAVKTFITNYKPIMEGSYSEELIFDVTDEINTDGENKYSIAKALQKFTNEHIFSMREIQKLELTGETVIRGLLDHFVDSFLCYNCEDSKHKARAKKLFSLVSNSLKNIVIFETNMKEFCEWNNYYKLRLIVDYISGMTDGFALNLYQELQGIKK